MQTTFLKKMLSRFFFLVGITVVPILFSIVTREVAFTFSITFFLALIFENVYSIKKRSAARYLHSIEYHSEKRKKAGVFHFFFKHRDEILYNNLIRNIVLVTTCTVLLLLISLYYQNNLNKEQANVEKEIAVLDKERLETLGLRKSKSEKLIPIASDIKPLLPPDDSGITNSYYSKPKNIYVSERIFTDLLHEVIDNNWAAHDFDNYLCDKGETRVIANGRYMTFNALCEDISGKKRRKFIIGSKPKVKIDSVRLRRDGNGCVLLMEVDYH